MSELPCMFLTARIISQLVKKLVTHDSHDALHKYLLECIYTKNRDEIHRFRRSNWVRYTCVNISLEHEHTFISQKQGISYLENASICFKNSLLISQRKSPKITILCLKQNAFRPVVATIHPNVITKLELKAH
jgi:hypothetical protein